MPLTESAGGSVGFNAGGNTVTTGSYTPASNSLQVCIAAVGNGNDFTWTNFAISDSVSGTWTQLIRVMPSFQGAAGIWVKDAGSSPSAQTVTATATISSTTSGMLIVTRQFAGALAAAQQNGVTASSSAGTPYSLAITPGSTGSQVVGGFGRSTDNQVFTANGSTTLFTYNNGTAGDTEALFEANALSVAGTPITVGASNAASGANTIALAEILPAFFVAGQPQIFQQAIKRAAIF